MTPELEQEIRAEFEKWYLDNQFPCPTQQEYEIAFESFLAGRASARDNWHDAVLHQCMVIEGCYQKDDPAATLSALIDYHIALANEVIDTVKVHADAYLQLTCGTGAGKPFCYGVVDEQNDVCFTAGWPEACHEHINNAINEHDLPAAAKWKVIPLYRLPPEIEKEMKK